MRNTTLVPSPHCHNALSDSQAASLRTVHLKVQVDANTASRAWVIGPAQRRSKASGGEPSQPSIITGNTTNASGPKPSMTPCICEPDARAALAIAGSWAPVATLHGGADNHRTSSRPLALEARNELVPCRCLSFRRPPSRGCREIRCKRPSPRIHRTLQLMPAA